MESPTESEIARVRTPDRALDGLTDEQVDRILDTLYPVREWPPLDCDDDQC